MKRRTFRPISRTFAAAVANHEVEMAGQRIEYVSGDIDIRIRLDGTSEDELTLEEGEGIEDPDGFTRFYISTDAAGTIVLQITTPVSLKKVSAKAKIDEILKLEKTSNGTFAAVSVTNAVGGTLIAASNANRKALTISPIGGTIYVGEFGVTVANGFPIAAGGSLTLDRFTGAVYGISAGAVDTRYIIEGV